MTVFLPLEASSPFPQTPTFLVPSPSLDSQVKKVVKALLKARRIAVVCGAGISVHAGIPDFRSSEGLFQTLKKDNPTLSSGRDLFDASVFNSEVTTSLFCQMIAQLSKLSEDAMPTAFHKLLRVLDDRGRLLRVYTQNIDALESKSGLSFGVPDIEGKRVKPRSTKCKTETSVNVTDDAVSIPTVESLAGSSRLPSPPVETPRCIPLHGTLQLMHCQICNHSFPLRDHLSALNAGRPPFCPECTNLEETRLLVGKRSRGVGKLRPSVVLYNEMHKDGEGVGDVVRRDLIGNSKGKGRAGADLLLVVGTSLRVPGTKRIVREFAKAVRSRSAASSCCEPSSSSSSSTGLATPTPSPRRSPADEEEPPIKTVYLNFDFPVPTREWDGVFDVWLQGDAQQFAQLVFDEIEREARAKEAAIERKRRREEVAEEREIEKARERELLNLGKTKSGKKRKNAPTSTGSMTPAKKRKPALLTPVSMPKSSRTGKGKSASTVKRRVNKKTKSKDQMDDVLPALGHKVMPNERLMIKIPARRSPTNPPLKRSRQVPEVVITTSPRHGRIGPPTPSPPDSPLTSVPPTSPHSRHRTESPSKRDPSPFKTMGTRHTYGANSVHWDTSDELSDLTDDTDDGEDFSQASYTHTVQRHVLGNGLATG